jgi:hypothetical protein
MAAGRVCVGGGGGGEGAGDWGEDGVRMLTPMIPPPVHFLVTPSVLTITLRDLEPSLDVIIHTTR